MSTLKVQDLLKRHLQQVKAQGCYDFEDIKTDGPACCDWDLRLEVPGLTVEGQLNATVVVECARCLETFDIPVSVPVAERYVFSQYVDDGDGGERELQAEDFFEVIEEDGELDLKDLVHQLLILETSDDTLCGRPDCQVVATTG